MADLITLNCPTCGGNLQVTNDVERFVCAHCGNAHIIDPGVRVESLAGELDQMRLVMDIRQAEDSLAVLQNRKLELEKFADVQSDMRRFFIGLSIVLPIGTIFLGIREGSGITLTLLLAAFLSGFMLLVNLILSVSKPSSEQLELRRVNEKIESGSRTLSFLKQELQQVTGKQHATKDNRVAGENVRHNPSATG